MSKPKVRNRARAIGIVSSIVHIAPTYERYQRATKRIIPLMRLMPVGRAGKQDVPSCEVVPGRKELSFTE